MAPNPSIASTNIIKTPRLLLRPLTANDSSAVYALRSDPTVFYWKKPEDRLQSDQWLETRLASPRCFIYIVELLPTNSTDPTNSQATISPNFPPNIIGLTGAHILPEVGYIFTPSSWGKGYATEALRGWMEWYWRCWPEGHPILDEEGEERGYLKAETGPDGVGSRGVLRKCGFGHVGAKEVEEEAKGGRVVVDCWRFERPK